MLQIMLCGCLKVDVCISAYELNKKKKHSGPHCLLLNILLHVEDDSKKGAALTEKV